MDANLHAVIDHSIDNLQRNEAAIFRYELLSQYVIPCATLLEQSKLQCSFFITFFKVNRSTKEFEVSHDVLVVHNHLTGG